MDLNFRSNLKVSLILCMSIVAFLTSCFQSGPMEGSLYYITNENGTYSVLKILKTDDKGVHIRLYSNQYASPPSKIDESALYMAGVDHKPNEGMGMGHLPLSKASFASWHATFLQKSTVKSDELEGYKMWLDAQGGYF